MSAASKDAISAPIRALGLDVPEKLLARADDVIEYVMKKLEDMGQLDNTIVVFTTDNGAEVITYPDGGNTPFKGGKLTTSEGDMRAPAVIRWPGQIKPGTVLNDIFASYDWLPTFVEIAGGQGQSPSGCWRHLLKHPRPRPGQALGADAYPACCKKADIRP